MADRKTDQSLGAVGIFRDLSPADRAAMAAELDKLQLARGETVVSQGQPADALYIVVSGRFEVHVRGRSAPVAEIGPGMPIGEIAFLAGGERTATVTAVRDSLVLRLGRAEFDRLCQRAPQIWRTLTATLANRLADQTAGRNDIEEPVPRTVTLIPAGPRPMPDAFVEMVRAAFAAHGRTQVVRSSDLPGLAGVGSDLSGGELTERLNALESANDLVLYVADAGLTAWSEKAIRQADLVLRVGLAEPVTAAPVVENDHERFAARLLNRNAQRLVLLHARRAAPVGTRHWLQHRMVRMHHHVALCDPSDVDRLVRFVNGRALGLVTCGGGAFCAAHVGLYKAMLEAGVAFDAMGGTSGGSAMAAAFAMGVAPDEIAEVIKEVFVTQRAMRRYTLPRYSILDHTYFDRLLGPHYKGTDIEDLWIPFFAISTNLSRYSLHKHLDGDLWHAVRASGSVPALLPPFYTDDGQMLVDGCLLDNVPIRIMHEVKRGPNVVIAFEVPQLERFSVDYRALPSRGELLRNFLLPFGRTPLPVAPSLGSVLLRSLMANRQDFERYLRPDDLLLVPPLPTDMNILDWGRHGALIRDSHVWCADEIARHLREGHAALARARPGAGPAIPRVAMPSTRRDQS
jgi:NTE family protein